MPIAHGAIKPLRAWRSATISRRARRILSMSSRSWRRRRCWGRYRRSSDAGLDTGMLALGPPGPITSASKKLDTGTLAGSEGAGGSPRRPREGGGMPLSGRPLLLLTAWSLVTLPPAAANPPEAPSRLRAAEIAFAPLAHLTRTVMRHELDVLLSPAGLGLSWRQSRPSDETAAAELRVVLMRSSGVGGDQGALGSTSRRGTRPDDLGLPAERDAVSRLRASGSGELARRPAPGRNRPGTRAGARGGPPARPAGGARAGRAAGAGAPGRAPLASSRRDR